MNGDTNGTMEDPLDVSVPSFPNGTKAMKTNADPDVKIAETNVSDNGDDGSDVTEKSNAHIEKASKLSVESDPLMPPKENCCQETDNNNDLLASLQIKPKSKEQADGLKPSTNDAKPKSKEQADGLKPPTNDSKPKSKEQADGLKPSTNDAKPKSKEQADGLKPSTNDAKPKSKEQADGLKPSTNDSKPKSKDQADGLKPSTNAAKPKSKEQADGLKPSTNDAKPKSKEQADGLKPSTNDAKPTSKGQADGLKPSTNDSKPKSKDQADGLKPSTNNAKDEIKHIDLDEENTQDTIQDSDELDSEANSSDEVISDGSERNVIDTVSINSDSEHDLLTDEDDPKKQSDIIFVDSNFADKKNGIRNSLGNPEEVHEIESDNDDDCVVTSEEVKSVKSGKMQTTLRRSRRSQKRKSYTGQDDEDIQLVGVIKAKVKKRNKAATFMKHVKSFIQQASKFKKADFISKNFVTVQGKPPELIPKRKKLHDPVNVEELYQSIAARGTTVTPVSRLTATASSVTPSPVTVPVTVPAAVPATAPATAHATANVATQSTQPPILPSLTDDMFVVEAPSFVVPYVYEKPSEKPFREFVDNLGKQLEEERAKEEQENMEKENVDKESAKEPEKSEEGAVLNAPDAPNEKEKTKKKARKRRKNDADDASWDSSDESEVDSEDDTNVSDEDKRVVVKDVDDLKVTKDVLASKDEVAPAKTGSYFDGSLGKFFMEIAEHQVHEYVQNDLLRLHHRKLNKEKKKGKRTRETEVAIALLSKNIELSKSINKPFTFKQKKCEFCSFQTESMLVMSNHFETPHMKNGLYKCNFCPAEIRTPHEIMLHMEAMHKIQCKLEKAPGNHQCVNCPFEDNGKVKLARHLITCAKRFKPDINLSPPTVWEPPAKIPKVAKSRGNAMGAVGTGFKGPQMNNNFIRAPMNLVSGGNLSAFRPRSQLPAASLTRPQLTRPNIIVRQFAPTPVAQQNKPANQQPSLSITPLPRAPHAALAAPAPAKGTFVICEICDGYIKDLDQLRNHMQWIHKVKIHPKMIYNRPPLNCQKCQFRFFTDQGLERHLLGSHGLVTSSMQEAANKGKDAGRCPVCGRVYQWKLLHHVAKDHNLTLKPAHLSYKCTVCTATFGMYKLFENHVYTAHRVMAKRAMDKGTPPAKEAEAKNDESPLPAKAAATVTSETK